MTDEAKAEREAIIAIIDRYIKKHNEKLQRIIALKAIKQSIQRRNI